MPSQSLHCVLVREKARSTPSLFTLILITCPFTTANTRPTTCGTNYICARTPTPACKIFFVSNSTGAWLHAPRSITGVLVIVHLYRTPWSLGAKRERVSWRSSEQHQCQHVHTRSRNGVAVFVLARVPAGLSLKAHVKAWDVADISAARSRTTVWSWDWMSRTYWCALEPY